jgi:hypothetical protein
MPRVMVVSPSPKDATSFYRAFGVIPNLKAQLGQDWDFTSTHEHSWVTMVGTDVLYLQRPFTEDHLTLAKMAEACQTKLWVDYDDDLFAVPVGNPAHQTYGKEETKRRIAQIVARAHLVTVSTPALFERLKPLNSNVVCVPNALNDDLFGKFPAPEPPHKLVLWRGSPTHDPDLASVLPEILQAVDQHQDWTFAFLGAPFWALRRALDGKKNVVFSDPVDPIEYWQVIARIRPAIMLVPLERNDFNASKSNIAWIEGAWAGAVTVAPAMPEWERPGVFNYQKQSDFLEVLHHAMSIDDEEHARTIEAAREALPRLSKVNALRAAELRKLIR